VPAFFRPAMLRNGAVRLGCAGCPALPVFLPVRRAAVVPREIRVTGPSKTSPSVRTSLQMWAPVDRPLGVRPVISPQLLGVNEVEQLFA
jgi:hypothetical protein